MTISPSRGRRRVKRKPTRADCLALLMAYADMLGIGRFYRVSCGCAGVEIAGKAIRIKCASHRHEWPRECACGTVQRLTAATARMHRLGDMVAVTELREERKRHFGECGG